MLLIDRVKTFYYKLKLDYGKRRTGHDEGSNNQLPIFNPLLPNGGGVQEPPSRFFTNIFWFSKLCSALLRIPKQMDNAHFGENCITETTLLSHSRLELVACLNYKY